MSQVNCISFISEAAESKQQSLLSVPLPKAASPVSVFLGRFEPCCMAGAVGQACGCGDEKWGSDPLLPAFSYMTRSCSRSPQGRPGLAILVFPPLRAAASHSSPALPQAGKCISQPTRLNSTLSKAGRRRRRRRTLRSCFLLLRRWAGGRGSAWKTGRARPLPHVCFGGLAETFSCPSRRRELHCPASGPPLSHNEWVQVASFVSQGLRLKFWATKGL